jgi:hypothetical protein
MFSQNSEQERLCAKPLSQMCAATGIVMYHWQNNASLCNVL